MKFTISKICIIFLLLLATGFRLWQHFHYEIIIGTNGGYYPLQVLHILSTGKMAFADMPLYFYLNAAILKLLSFFGLQISTANIIITLKIVDSIILPLLVIPFLQFTKKMQYFNFSLPTVLPVTFLLFSFSSLALIGDLQKNLFSLLWLLYFITHLYHFYETLKLKTLFYALTFLLLCALTHFGTAAVAMLFALISALAFGKRKHILITIVGTLGIFAIIAIFDFSRFLRIVNLGQVLFEKPFFLQPLQFPDFIQIVYSITLIIITYLGLKNIVKNISKSCSRLLLSMLILQFILVLPLYDSEYYKRFNLFLFIFQSLTIAFIIKSKSNFIRKTVIISSIAFILFSLAGHLKKPKTPAITDKAYKNLFTLQGYIKPQAKVIIIARHGLEWWTNLALKFPVAQDKAINSSLINKYDILYFLIQKSGCFTGHDPKLNPFQEPMVPPDASLVQKNEYFELWMLTLVKNKQ